MDSFVYCWTDHKTGMLYVGYHKGTETDGYVSSSKTFNEIYRERPEDFTRQIIANCITDDCLLLETRICKTLDVKNDNCFYNKHNGDGKFLNKFVSDETRKKISQSNRGRPKSLEHRAALSRSKTGKKRGPRDPGIVAKIAASNRGKKRDSSFKEKMRSVHKGVPKPKRTPDHQAKLWASRRANQEFVS